MVRKLLIDADNFLPPFFQSFRELVAFDLTPDWGSSAMKRMIKIMKYLVFLSPVMEIGTLFVVFSSRISLSIIDWFVTKMVKPSMQASHMYLSQGAPATFVNPRLLSFKNVLWRPGKAHGTVVNDEDLRAEVPKLEVVSSRVVYKCALCMCLCIRRQVSIEPNHLRYSCWHIESLILSTLPHTLSRVPRAKNADLVVSE